MSANGENYYLDNKGTVMPPDAKCVAHLAIVTGNVEKSFAMRDLYKFGVFLQKNSFWNAQIEQIHVLPGKNIELVPRVGDHLIYLGKIAGFEKKLKRVKGILRKRIEPGGLEQILLCADDLIIKFNADTGVFVPTHLVQSSFVECLYTFQLLLESGNLA